MIIPEPKEKNIILLEDEIQNIIDELECSPHNLYKFLQYYKIVQKLKSALNYSQENNITSNNDAIFSHPPDTILIEDMNFYKKGREIADKEDRIKELKNFGSKHSLAQQIVELQDELTEIRKIADKNINSLNNSLERKDIRQRESLSERGENPCVKKTESEEEDIIVLLEDLLKQATTENSHYYTANIIGKAIQEINQLRKEFCYKENRISDLIVERDELKGFIPKNASQSEIKEYKKAYEVLLERLKRCGNLTTTEKFDENSGELHMVRSNNLIEIIEGYMCEVLDELNASQNKVDAHTKVSMDAYDKGFEIGKSFGRDSTDSEVTKSIAKIVNEKYNGDFTAFWLDEFKKEGVTKEQLYETFKSLDDNAPQSILTKSKENMNKKNNTYENVNKGVNKGCGKPFYDRSCFGACRENDLCPECKKQSKEYNSKYTNSEYTKQSKGCGKKMDAYGYIVCGQFDDLKHGGKQWLCDECKVQSKKNSIDEAIKLAIKMYPHKHELAMEIIDYIDRFQSKDALPILNSDSIKSESHIKSDEDSIRKELEKDYE